MSNWDCKERNLVLKPEEMLWCERCEFLLASKAGEARREDR